MHRLCLFMITLNGSINRVKRDMNYGLQLLEGKSFLSELQIIRSRISASSYSFEGMLSLQSTSEDSLVKRLINKAIEYAKMKHSQVSILKSCEDGFTTQTLRESQSQNLSVNISPFESKELSCERVNPYSTNRSQNLTQNKNKTPVIAKSLHIKQRASQNQIIIKDEKNANHKTGLFTGKITAQVIKKTQITLDAVQKSQECSPPAMLPKEMMVESFDESEITMIHGSATPDADFSAVPVPPTDICFTGDISTQAKIDLIADAMECVRESPKEKQGSYMFNLLRCGVAVPKLQYDDELICVELPQETIADYVSNHEDTTNVFNKLLDIESQAFSDRGNWYDGLGENSSFTSSLRSRTLALVEKVRDEDGSPLIKQRRPIDMNIIQRIKALRANTTDGREPTSLKSLEN